MNSITSVYVLKPILTDPRYEGFIFGPSASSLLGFERAYDDFLVDDGESLNWQPRRLGAVWEPQPVVGPVNAFNDYPCLELTKPVFSQRAVNVLGDLLVQNGELLPLAADVGEYFAFVLLTKIDALDLNKSQLGRVNKHKPAATIPYFAFRKAELDGASIFRVPEQPNLYLVTDRFKDRVEQAGLNGFNFIKVWPLPEGSDWMLNEATRRKNHKNIKLVGEALVLRFGLKDQEPSVREKELAMAIEDSLALLLRVESLEDKYWGAIEVAEFEDSEFRIFCTCPDCEQLSEYLSDWIDGTEWEHELAIVKRYGNLYDSRAKEKCILIRKPFY